MRVVRAFVLLLGYTSMLPLEYSLKAKMLNHFRDLRGKVLTMEDSEAYNIITSVHFPFNLKI